MSSDSKELMDPALFAQLLENQRQELALKEKEIDLEREKMSYCQIWCMFSVCGVG